MANQRHSLVFSCDDGCESDVRLASLLKKYAIPCIFYWPCDWHSLAYLKGWKPLSLSQAQSILEEPLFSLGSHTITHRYLTDIPLDEAEYEIIHSKEMLETIFAERISSFCFPRGRTSSEIDKIVQANYSHWRPTKGHDSDGRRLVHVHPDSGANDNRAWRTVAESSDEPLHLWLHSWELDRMNLWKELEYFLDEYTSGKLSTG